MNLIIFKLTADLKCQDPFKTLGVVWGQFQTRLL